MRLTFTLSMLICVSMFAQPITFAQEAKADQVVGDPLPEGAIARLGTSRFRGAGQLNGIAVSPDGKFLGTTNAAGTTRIWNISSGRLLAHVSGRMPRNSGVVDHNLANFAFSHDSQLVAVIHSSKGVVVKKTQTGEDVEGGMKQLTSISGDSIYFSPDDSSLIVRKGRELETYLLKTGERVVNDYDPKHGTPGQLKARMFGSGVSFYKDGKYQPEKIKSSFKFVGFALSGDERTIAGGSRDGNVALYKIPGGEHLFDLPNHDGDVAFLSLSKDGTVLATASKYNGNRVRIWKLKREKDGSVKEANEWLPDGGHIAGIKDLFFVGDKVLSTSIDNTGRLWKLETKKEIKRFPKAYKASVSKNGETLAVYGLNSGPQMQLYDLGMSDDIREIREWEGTAAVAISPDGNQLAYLTKDKLAKIQIENIATEKLVQQLDTGTYSAYTLMFSPDDSLIALGGTAGKLRVWEVATGKLKFETTEASNQRVAFSADSKRLFSTPKRHRDSGPAIQVWDLATGEVQSSFGVNVRLMSFAVMNDNRRLIGGCYDGKIRVWDIKSGRVIATLPGHQAFVMTVALSANNTKLLSGSIDSEILVWDLSKLPKAE